MEHNHNVAKGVTALIIIGFVAWGIAAGVQWGTTRSYATGTVTRKENPCGSSGKCTYMIELNGTTWFEMRIQIEWLTPRVGDNITLTRENSQVNTNTLNPVWSLK